MKDLFIKKYWAEDDVLFYLHFQNGEAVEQIEVTSSGSVFLSVENPIQGDSMLYDQTIEELDLNERDFIGEEEFINAWNQKK
jgi:hypothetical protein